MFCIYSEFPTNCTSKKKFPDTTLRKKFLSMDPDLKNILYCLPSKTLKDVKIARSSLEDYFLSCKSTH